MTLTNLAVLITCHNRRETTLFCLKSLTENNLPRDVSLNVILVDDGSTDGTASAVKEKYPFVEILKGEGNLYWNGGMHKAFAFALDTGFDYYLWLNDDTVLDPNAIMSLLATSEHLKEQEGRQAIVVGSTRDDVTGRTTYGGLARRVAWKRTTFSLVEPGKGPKECETMNGNCVLIPKIVAEKVGNLDPCFIHAMGDTDYGLRAQRAGFSAWLAPGHLGTCPLNKTKGNFNDKALSRRARLRLMMQPKGLPPASWKIFTRRHSGALWVCFWLWPYLRTILQSSKSKR